MTVSITKLNSFPKWWVRMTRARRSFYITYTSHSRSCAVDWRDELIAKMMVKITQMNGTTMAHCMKMENEGFTVTSTILY